MPVVDQQQRIDVAVWSDHRSPTACTAAPAMAPLAGIAGNNRSGWTLNAKSATASAL